MNHASTPRNIRRTTPMVSPREPTVQMSALTVHTTTIVSTVDPEWIRFVTGGTEGGFAEVFFAGCAGYWLRCVGHDPQLGYLAFEHGGDRDLFPADTARIVAVDCWREGTALPPGWHRLDLSLACRAWEEGVRAHGEQWFASGVTSYRDEAIQRACFAGELIYG